MNVATMVILGVLAFMMLQWVYSITKNIYNAPKGSTISWFKAMAKAICYSTMAMLVVGGVSYAFIGTAGLLIAAGPLNCVVAFWIYYTIKNGKLIL